ncbi:premnaspirodiene oxygenase [Phtheirospermum japonicum]|uniref:Premnaspirodiene oxygenase n=1 Tax=Phtheirospermum japonicum TaxID=374723 RepID=A0A830BRE8_9LAMI|nr:premnaspirodiene oxygenase [Phtheirospermum japonicum]
MRDDEEGAAGEIVERLKWNKPKDARSVKLPPGPKMLPIIGNLHHITSLPFRSFRDLSKQYGPIMHFKLGEASAIVVSSPEISKEILKDNDPNYANRGETIAVEIMWYNYTNLVFSPYGEYWRQMRKICILELLSVKSVRSFGSIRNDELSRLIQSIRLSSGKPVNLTENIFSMINSVTCRAMCGTVCIDKVALIKLLKDGLQLAGGFEIADLFPSSKIVSALSWSRRRLVRMRQKIDVILDGIIDEHKQNLLRMAGESEGLARRGNGESGSEDLIDVLLRVKESGELEFPISYDNIKGVLLDLFTAGTDTSSATIDWAMTELMRNPRVMAKAQAEVRQAFQGTRMIEEHDVQKLKYLKLVIKESLRLHPPVPLLPRASRDERVINGYTVPAKTRVLVNCWAMQRDPKYWKNPESFEPERFESQAPDFVGGDFQYLPFGSGRRMCPGINFGLASVEMPLAQFLYSFDWKLPDGVRAEHLDMMELQGITASRKDHLFVVATPYQSLA